VLPADEQAAVQALLRQLDFHGGELAIVDKELAIKALTDPVAARLMTIPGVAATAAISIVAAVGGLHPLPACGRAAHRTRSGGWST
jgi:transposase